MSAGRIVSLVPSLTETVVRFGLIERLVGRTDYCVEPAGRIEAVEAVGGTKNPDVARIIELAPDLVLVNKEENRREDCRRLERAGLRLHVTHPRSVREAIAMIEELGGLLGVEAAAERLAADCRAALARCDRALGAGPPRLAGSSLAESATPASAPRPRVFCPIWRRPWMTFRDRTYVGDMLVSVGCVNVFGSEVDNDFFEVSLDEVKAARPALVLLPSEPYSFKAEHAGELARAGIEAPCIFIDGMDLAWYGPRTPDALDRLREAVMQAPL